MTVYITQEVRGRDLSDALEFGELDILIPFGDQVSLSAMPTLRRMERKLVKFTSDDYLMLSGIRYALVSHVRLLQQRTTDASRV